jgi:hypothetical protein
MMTPERLAAELTARLDGPHADEHTAGAAELAPAAVRFLNYATGAHAEDGLRFPGTVYSVAGDLSAAAYGLPQTCRQLAGWLDAGVASGYLGADDGSDPAGPVREAAAGLAGAAGQASRLAAALADVQSALGSVNARGEARS